MDALLTIGAVGGDVMQAHIYADSVAYFREHLSAEEISAMDQRDGVLRQQMGRLMSVILATVFAILMMQASSFATPIAFDLAWSGASFGNSASATGSITSDDSLLLNPGNNDFSNTPGYVIDFSITAMNASSGNGTWGLADFDEIIWQTYHVLDLTHELIGQPTTQEPWGSPQPANRSLKKERIRKQIYRTRDAARADIFDYIEMFYIRTRRQSHLGHVSPEVFEQNLKCSLNVSV